MSYNRLQSLNTAKHLASTIVDNGFPLTASEQNNWAKYLSDEIYNLALCNLRMSNFTFKPKDLTLLSPEQIAHLEDVQYTLHRNGSSYVSVKGQGSCIYRAPQKSFSSEDHSMHIQQALNELNLSSNEYSKDDSSIAELAIARRPKPIMLADFIKPGSEVDQVLSTSAVRSRIKP